MKRLLMILMIALGATAGCASNTIEQEVEVEAGGQVELVARASRASLRNLGPGELSVSVSAALERENANYGPARALAKGESWRGSARGVRILVVNVSGVAATLRALVSGSFEGMTQLVVVTRDQDVAEE